MTFACVFFESKINFPRKMPVLEDAIILIFPACGPATICGYGQ